MGDNNQEVKGLNLLVGMMVTAIILSLAATALVTIKGYTKTVADNNAKQIQQYNSSIKSK